MTHENETKRYPLDFDAIAKGDQWTPDELEQITSTRRGTTQYQFACLELRMRIMRECLDRGKPVTAAMVKGSLRVLTDEEASLYNAKIFRVGQRKSARSLGRLSRVNIANLTESQKQEHERNILVFGRMLAASRRAQRGQLKLIAHARQVPGITQQQDSGLG